MVASKIYMLIKSASEALTTREICCILNGVDRDYCLNVDGRGGRCVW